MNAENSEGARVILPGRLCDGLKPLAKNQHFTASIDEACKLVVVQRSSLAFGSSAQLVSSFGQVEHMLFKIPREEYKFLGDTRNGPGRNDPRYEEDLKRVRHKLLGGYLRSATVTRTVVGQMQVRRYAQQDGREMLVTSVLALAFQYLDLPRHYFPPLVG